MSDQRRKVFKTTLYLVCQLLWVVGLMVAVSGAYLLLKFSQRRLFFSDTYITVPAIVAFASAAFLLASSWLGSWVTQRDSTCLQGLFVYLLLVVFCLEGTASALAYFHSTRLDSEIVSISGVFQNYTGSSQDSNSRAVDATQEELQCCGVQGYRDWLETSWFKNTGGLFVPRSCCNTTFLSCNGTVDEPRQLYSQGCQVKLRTAFQFVLNFIIRGAPVVFLVEVLALLIVVQLMRHQRLMDYHVLHKN